LTRDEYLADKPKPEPYAGPEKDNAAYDQWEREASIAAKARRAARKKKQKTKYQGVHS
jgi:hypothetical protein